MKKNAFHATDVCPALLTDVKRDIPEREKSDKCYAAWSLDDSIHFNSSSGGMSYVFAQHFIENGGIVAGVWYDNESNIVRHIIIDDLGDIGKIIGSKYALSNKENIYSRVCKLLEQGRTVLFFGVGCEVNALYHFLHEKNCPNQNLYTVDLLCHGGSSSKCLTEHTDFMRKNKKVSVKFRGGKYDCMYTLWNSDNKLLYKSAQLKDSYFRLFMRRVLYQERCYSCPFADSDRTGDLTLADFWGLDKSVQAKSKVPGINFVKVNSKKGKDLFAAVNDKIMSIERPLEEAIAGNDTLKAPTEMPPEYNEFWRAIRSSNYSSAIKQVYGYSEVKDYYKDKLHTVLHLVKEKISNKNK